MKIVVTGSLGNISKPLTKELVKKGHEVTVISTNKDKVKEIESLGATAAIGSLNDAGFLTNTFKGADLVYTMNPPANFFDPGVDLLQHYIRIADSYVMAIQQSGVKRVVNLSSIGAHLSEGTGVIVGSHMGEVILNKLTGVSITHMRPASFYYNLLGYAGTIKQTGMIMANYGGDDMVIWVSPFDIATAIAEEIETAPEDRKIRYVASEERTANEVAGILGSAIGKPDLKWIVISDEQMQKALEGIGMPPKSAAGLSAINSSIHSGKLFEDYLKNRPAVLGKVKLKDFAKDFAAAFDKEFVH